VNYLGRKEMKVLGKRNEKQRKGKLDTKKLEEGETER
jgi:hypothetical protein